MFSIDANNIEYLTNLFKICLICKIVKVIYKQFYAMIKINKHKYI
jgi:hypothetical protein